MDELPARVRALETQVEQLLREVRALRAEVQGQQPGLNIKQWLRLKGLPSGCRQIELIEKFIPLLQQGYTREEIRRIYRFSPNNKRKPAALDLAEQWLRENEPDQPSPEMSP